VSNPGIKKGKFSLKLRRGNTAGVMLMQVGGEGSRPTFFEMSAAQNLPSSLRSALLYSLGVSFL